MAGKGGMAEYMRNRRKLRRAKFVELLGGKCYNCHATDNLQFDHQNPKNKKYDYNNIKDAPQELILNELQKCRLLCSKCHLAKTKANKEHVNRDKSPARHSTIHMYKTYSCRCRGCRRAMRLYNLKKKIKH